MWCFFYDSCHSNSKIEESQNHSSNNHMGQLVKIPTTKKERFQNHVSLTQKLDFLVLRKLTFELRITVKRIVFCIYPNNTNSAKSRFEALDSRLPLSNAKTKQILSAFRNRFSNIWLEMIYNLVHHLSNTPKDNTKFGITILKLKLFIIIRPNVMIEIPTTTPSLVCEFIITVISSMYKKKIYKNKIHPYHKLNFNTNWLHKWSICTWLLERLHTTW
jgi:hypothetical protein